MDTIFSNSLEISKKQPRHRKVTFKKYEMQQDFLLPPSTEDYLPVNHIARLISKIVDNIDLTSLMVKYTGGGASAFHPRMMLKVWLLGYVKKIYTSRKLEKALYENIAFMWISGRQTPDFKTLSNFRLLLVDDIKKIFKNIVQMGLELGIIEGKDIFIDHTKIQANANPYKMVWKKSIDKKLSKIDEELEILFNFINELNEKEDSKYGNDKFDNLKETIFDKENIDSLINKINQDLKKGEVNTDDAKNSKEKLKRVKELLDRKEKAETQKEILGERNSYSKTDIDASAMKMKRSEEIKPAYNEGVVTENSFITSFDVSQNASDTVSFKKMINETIENIGHNPESVSADAG
jgi:transposase